MRHNLSPTAPHTVSIDCSIPTLNLISLGNNYKCLNSNIYIYTLILILRSPMRPTSHQERIPMRPTSHPERIPSSPREAQSDQPAIQREAQVVQEKPNQTNHPPKRSPRSPTAHPREAKVAKLIFTCTRFPGSCILSVFVTLHSSLLLICVGSHLQTQI